MAERAIVTGFFWAENPKWKIPQSGYAKYIK
jgi:hypothetical protein